MRWRRAILAAMLLVSHSTIVLAQSDLESSKLAPGAVIQGDGLESPKVSPGVVVQGGGMQSPKIAPGVVLQGNGLNSSKMSAGVIVQTAQGGGGSLVMRAPLTHW